MERAVLQTKRSRTLTVLTIGTIWLACSPTEPCACPPTLTHAVVHGFAYTESGAPVQASVFVAAFDEGCLGEMDGAVIPDGATPTGADGSYEAHVYSPYAPREACLRVTGVATVGGARDSAVVQGVHVSMVSERSEPRRLRVDLIFGDS